MSDQTSSSGSGERIAKVMARAGLCSRREAETWIAAGRVKVNGKTINSPALDVTAQDRVEVDGQPMPVKERTRLFLFHKPRGLVTTNADPQGRPTIFQALPRDLPRLITVGRLDINSEGLLLLTNDGGLARALELPETGWLRTYRVRAHGQITQERLDRLQNGISVDGINYGSIDATLDRTPGANVWITFAIREGKNREVRNVLGALGLDVNRLIRVSYGPFELGDMPEGAIVELPTRELRARIGDRVAQLAAIDLSSPVGQAPRAPRPAVPTRRDEARRPEAPRRDDKGRGDAAPRRTGSRTEASSSERRPPRDGERPRREGDRPRRDGERPPRDGDRPPREGDRAPRKEKRETKHHSDTHAWRGGDKPLRRKYRGSKNIVANRPGGEQRAEMVADRKGRAVKVERIGDKKPERTDDRRNRPPAHGARKNRPPPRGRHTGPRPARPR